VRSAVEASERAQRAVLSVQKLEALGRLTGGIAHDFNNLLQTMTTGIRVAGRLTTDSRAKNALDSCERAVTKAVRLTRQLMTFGSSQPGHREVIDLQQQLGSLHELLRGALRESIAIRIDVVPGTWPVDLDPVQLELAVLNLALNARDAIDGSGEVVVTATNRTLHHDEVPGVPAGEHVAVVVQDTGHGIAPDVLARVFEPFFTTKPMGKGAGLGLAQVYGFAKQLGGGASVDSQPGAGTRVTLWLPRADGVPQPRGLAVPVEEVPRFSGTVLLVEDDALVRGLTAETLESCGFTVLVAATVDDALALVHARPGIDAVLSDVVMPGGKSGVDLRETLRTLKPGLPVVLASGYADALAGDAGSVVIAKPYDAVEVARLLARQIARRG
jgi:CheY-like chemotaxis protein/two-component sensor histidine kinase